LLPPLICADRQIVPANARLSLTGRVAAALCRVTQSQLPGMRYKAHLMLSRNAIVLSVALLLAGQHALSQELFTDSGTPGGNTSRGQAAYVQSCLSCHGARLEGSPFGPALIGQDFMNRWRGRPAGELLVQMRNTMPPRGTGSVQPAIFPDLLAFLVNANLQGPPALQAPPTGTLPATASARPAELPPALARRLASLSPISEAMLAAPPAGDWLMWRRTFDSAGFSPLATIHRGNVQRLHKAWTLALDPGSNEITPLVHDGVLFVYSGAVVQAVDAASGRPLWRYEHDSRRQLPAGMQGESRRAPAYGGQRRQARSVALFGHALYVPTADGHVLALDARSGKLLWDRAINGNDAPNTGLQLSSGPLVARGMVMIGASLGLTNKGGCFIVALDALTGEERWRFHTVARPGTPGGDTWNDAPAAERFGGGVWTTGSYDPQLNLAYFGVGNTYNTATLLEPRAGSKGVTKNDGLYTNATLALRPETGELVWYHQHHRRDVWDQDWAFEQTLVTLGSGANARRAVVTSGKTAVFEAVDAATGQFLFAQDNGLNNLYASIDPLTGEKRTNPELEPVAGKPLLLCPSNLGARNWPATSFNPGTGVLFVPMSESCAEFTYQPRGREETASGGTDIRFSPRFRPDSDGNLGRVVALDLATQRPRWTHRQRLPLASSLLATAGGVVFASDLGRRLMAFDQEDGRILWHTALPAAAESTPITYLAGARQYVVVVSGEGSHLGNYNRGLAVELGAPNTTISLIAYSLPQR
jgi:alcohol dehydrogenase (cytochrome c)